MSKLGFVASVFSLLLTSSVAGAQCSPCFIWSSTSTPTRADSGESASIELGVKFRPDVNGFVTGVRFYKSAANGGTHVGNLWTTSGTQLASAQFANETSSGWQQVNFAVPVPITAGTDYVASYFTPLGHYAFDASYFSGAGVDNVPLHALADGVDGGNGVYNYSATSTFPNMTYSATNYWVDVVFVPQGSTTAPTIDSTSPANAAGGVSVVSSLNATFGTSMDPTTITSSTFQVYDATNTAVTGTVSYSSATTTATFSASAPFAYSASYTAIVRASVKDLFGNSLGTDFKWTFTTESAPSTSLCPCTIWPPTAVPGLADSGDSSSIEVGVKFQADLSGYITGIRFYKSAANAGTHIGNIWTTTGTLLGSVTFTGETSTGWQRATFSSPILVSANTPYVASYFAPSGHYGFDTNYFSANVNTAPLHALASAASGGDGVFSYGSVSTYPNSNYNATNYWVDVVYLPRNSTTPPTIVSTTPGNATTGVNLGSSLSVQFSEPMDATSITAAAIQVVDSSNNPVSGTVGYVSATASLVFQPSLGLTPLTVYTATINSSVRDMFGNSMASAYTWSFTAAPPPADSGPGGPILVIASSENPFSRYLGEILLAEGLNEFLVKDITTITPSILSQYDMIILGDFKLTSSQVSMLSSWVNGGGNLIAMHPDSQLASMLGISPTGSTVADGYLLIKQSGPGTGIYSSTMQFHGSADTYTLNGATGLATLYNNTTTPTAFPAVTLAASGSGQAAAFTYDLARSVVYLRQGNPAWSAQERVDYVDPATGTVQIRSVDLFYGNATTDPEVDWVNLGTVQVPQADEQQRLLANLILSMNASRKPLPRFWYLPSGFKAAVIMTGDDHGGNGTQPRFDRYIAQSPANCSVLDWTCVRATSYVFPANVTVTNYPTYIAEGFEIANHSDNDPTCTNFTPASLDASIVASQARMNLYFPLAPASVTNRTHCVLWSDYDSEPQILLNHGIRLDTTYYYWPDLWVQDRTGLYTGSGMPMRYADRNGNTINVYQAVTQLPDEDTWNFPTDIDILLQNAVGAAGFYAVITANMHTDSAISYWSDSIVAEAQAAGVPVVSSVQMLTWLDGRNGSSFGSLLWSGNTLSFTLQAAAGSRNMQAMLPVNSTGGTLGSISLNGAAVAYTTQTIKGITYAFFAANAGSYQAVYGYSISGTVAGAGAGQATVTLTGGSGNTTTTDASGNYSFGGLGNGAYTVTPSRTGVIYTPLGRTLTLNGAAITGINFAVQSAGIQSLSTTPAAVTGGSNSTATVLLAGAAPAGGAVVALASSNTGAASVPASVTVPANATSATFTVSSHPVATSTAVMLTATYNGTATTTLTVNAPWVNSVAVSPASVTGGISSTGTVTLSGLAPAGGLVVAISDNNSAATVPASVTIAANATTAAFSITTKTVTASTPVTITATANGTAPTTILTVVPIALSSVSVSPTSVLEGASSTGTVTLNGPAPAGGAVITLAANSAATSLPASVTVPANATSVTFTITTASVSAATTSTITATYNSGNKTATLVVNPWLALVSLSPTSLTGGTPSTGTVTVNGAAPAGGIKVSLASNSASATLPATVTVAPGKTTATVTISTTSVTATTTATITARFNLVSRTAALTINKAAVSTLTLNPTSVKGGATSTAAIMLTGPAPNGGATVTLSSSNTTRATVPASVVVSAGATSTTFPVTSKSVTSPGTVVITATYGVAKTATLTVTP